MDNYTDTEEQFNKRQEAEDALTGIGLNKQDGLASPFLNKREFLSPTGGYKLGPWETISGSYSLPLPIPGKDQTSRKIPGLQEIFRAINDALTYPEVSKDSLALAETGERSIRRLFIAACGTLHNLGATVSELTIVCTENGNTPKNLILAVQGQTEKGIEMGTSLCKVPAMPVIAQLTQMQTN